MAEVFIDIGSCHYGLDYRYAYLRKEIAVLVTVTYMYFAKG